MGDGNSGRPYSPQKGKPHLNVKLQGFSGAFLLLLVSGSVILQNISRYPCWTPTEAVISSSFQKDNPAGVGCQSLWIQNWQGQMGDGNWDLLKCRWFIVLMVFTMVLVYLCLLLVRCNSILQSYWGVEVYLQVTATLDENKRYLVLTSKNYREYIL